MDELADKLGIDRLEFRRRNALRAGDTTATGQVLAHSAGLAACLDALRPHWQRRCATRPRRSTRRAARTRRGVGIGCMWYGIGNTSMSNPVEHARRPVAATARSRSTTARVDIGQGSNTILIQIAADALGLPAAQFALVVGDTDLTADAGKTSASRQTFVSGKAAEARGRGPAPADPAAGQCRARRASCRSTARRLTVRDGAEVRTHRPRDDRAR